MGDFYRGARGDFYRGARGDIFGDIGGFITGTALPLLNRTFGPAGILTGARVATGQMSPFQALGTLLPAHSATAPGSTGTTMLPPFAGAIARAASRVMPAMGTLVTRGIQGSVGALKAAGRKLMVPEPGMRFHRRHRRINPLNPKALRRALRRAKGFEHFAREVVHITNPKKHVGGFKMPRKRKRRL